MEEAINNDQERNKEKVSSFKAITLLIICAVIVIGLVLVYMAHNQSDGLIPSSNVQETMMSETIHEVIAEYQYEELIGIQENEEAHDEVVSSESEVVDESIINNLCDIIESSDEEIDVESDGTLSDEEIEIINETEILKSPDEEIDVESDGTSSDEEIDVESDGTLSDEQTEIINETEILKSPDEEIDVESDGTSSDEQIEIINETETLKSSDEEINEMSNVIADTFCISSSEIEFEDKEGDEEDGERYEEVVISAVPDVVDVPKVEIKKSISAKHEDSDDETYEVEKYAAFSAIKANNLDLLKKLITDGVDIVKPRIKSGLFSAFHYAAFKLNVEAMRILLNDKPGFRVDSILDSTTKMTALHIVAYRGKKYPEKSAAAAEFLLSYGAKYNVIDGAENTPAFIAIETANVDLLNLLITKGFDAAYKLSKIDNNILHEAMHYCNRPIIKALIAYAPQLVDKTNRFNRAPIHEAAACDCVEGLKELILVHKVSKNKCSPTHLSSWLNSLIQTVDDANFLQGASPLHFAAKYNQRNAIEFLLMIRSDSAGKDCLNKTPRDYSHSAALKSYFTERREWELRNPSDGKAEDSVRLSDFKTDKQKYQLLENGYLHRKIAHEEIDENSAEENLETVFEPVPFGEENEEFEGKEFAAIRAINANDIKLLKKIIADGADVVTPRYNNFISAFHFAAILLNVDAMRILLESGYGVNDITCTKHKMTALYLVALRGNEYPKKSAAAGAFLLSRGADPNFIMADGRTAASNAIETANVDLLNLLIRRRVDVTYKFPENNNNLLHEAMFYCNRPIIKTLIAYAPQLVFEVNKFNRAPIHEAAAYNCVKGLKELILVHKVSKHTLSPLNYNNWISSKFDSKFDHPEYSLYGASPLHFAAKSGSRKAVCFLLMIQSSSSGEDHFKKTPLDYSGCGTLKEFY